MTHRTAAKIIIQDFSHLLEDTHFNFVRPTFHVMISVASQMIMLFSSYLNSSHFVTDKIVKLPQSRSNSWFSLMTYPHPVLKCILTLWLPMRKSLVKRLVFLTSEEGHRMRYCPRSSLGWQTIFYFCVVNYFWNQLCKGMGVKFVLFSFR